MELCFNGGAQGHGDVLLFGESRGQNFGDLVERTTRNGSIFSMKLSISDSNLSPETLALPGCLPGAADWKPFLKQRHFDQYFVDHFDVNENL